MNAPLVRRILTVAALTLLVLVCCQSLATACPNCKDALAQNDPTTAGLARGYGLSIVFMLSMPFLITGGLGTYFYLLVRQARKQALASGTLANCRVESQPVLHERPVAIS